MPLTQEQVSLIAAARDGQVLITAIGSPNDILWGNMAELGSMEPTDMPAEMAGLPHNMNAWRMTEGGKRRFDELLRKNVAAG